MKKHAAGFSAEEGGPLPPWLWILFAFYLFLLPYLISEQLTAANNLLLGAREPHIDLLTSTIPLTHIFVILAGLLTVLAPWARGAYLEWRFRLAEPNHASPALREMGDFIRGHAPNLSIKSNLLRTDQLAFVYPLGYRKSAIALFGGLVKLWRSDRQAAEAVLLHEIGHYRHGDVLIVGQGSLFSIFVRYGVFLSVLSLIIYGAALAYNTGLPTRPGSYDVFLVIVAILAAVPILVILELLFLAVTLLLPLVGIWCAELNADRFAVETRQSSDTLSQALKKLRHRGSRWRWLLSRLSHPPDRIRRWMALHAKRTRGVVVPLMLFPMATLIVLSAVVVVYLELFITGEGLSAVYITKYWVDWLVPYWFLMAALILFWPAVSGYWEWLFCGEYRAKGIRNWSRYGKHFVTALIMIGMAGLYYGAVPRTNGIPDPGPLAAGKYSTNFFDPALSFSVNEGWEVGDSSEGYGAFTIQKEGLAISFHDLGGVYEPSGPNKRIGEGVQSPPDDLVRWFQEHPYLYTTHPVPVTIGGVRGVQFDTGLSSLPKTYPPECKASCILLFDQGGSFAGHQRSYWIQEGWRTRIMVLQVESQTVVIRVQHLEVNFEESLREAEKVLATVEWREVAATGPQTFKMSEPSLLMVPVRGWLPAGQYLTEEFKPAFSFGVDWGWEVYATETDDRLTIGRSPENVGLGFSTIHEVYDPQEPDYNTLPAPDDMVAWFQEHPYLDSENLVPVSVGGISGTQLDVSVSSVPENYLADCRDNPCLPLWPHANGSWYGLSEGQGERMIILDVQGETVIVTSAGPEAKPDGTPPQVKEVMDTVKWRR